MKLKPVAAEKLYFMIQALRKEPVKRELKKLEQEFLSSKLEIQDRVWQRGRSLLLFALQHVQFYKKLDINGSLKRDVLAIKDFNSFENTLKCFPVIDKQTFIQRKKEFESSKFNEILGYKTYSSGSTGEPVAFKRDQDDWGRSHANLIKILQFFGVKFGAPYIYFWAGNWTQKRTFTDYLKDFVFNRKKIGTSNIESADLIDQVRIIKRYSPTYIYGIPSGIEKLARYLYFRNEKLDASEIRCVFTTGENLSDRARELIKEVFCAPVCDIYGCSEVGLIAFDCLKEKKHVLIDTNFVEILEDKNIIVTNFLQKKHAIIRYKVGDLSNKPIQWQPCSCGLNFPIMGEILGRDVEDILLPNSRRINSLAVAYIFDSVIFDGSLLEGRFVLNKVGDLLLYLIPGDKFSDDTINKLVKEAIKLFGIKPIIKIVDKIPALKNGKKVDFYSEWEKK